VSSRILLPSVALTTSATIVVDTSGVVLVGQAGSSLVKTGNSAAIELRAVGAGVADLVVSAPSVGVRMTGPSTTVDHVEVTTGNDGIVVEATDTVVTRSVLLCSDSCARGVKANARDPWSATLAGVWVHGAFANGVLASGSSSDALTLAHVTIDGVRTRGVDASDVELCAQGVALFDRGWSLSSTAPCTGTVGSNVVEPVAACTGNCTGLCPGPLCDTVALGAFDDALCPVGAIDQLDPAATDVCDEADAVSVGAADLGARESGCSWQIGANDYSCP
jgi:hypothetical protein